MKGSQSSPRDKKKEICSMFCTKDVKYIFIIMKSTYIIVKTFIYKA